MKDSILEIFRVNKPIIGMLHLGESQSVGVHDLAKREIEQMYENGVDAVLVENYFGSLEDVIWGLDYLKSQYSEYVYGVNVLGGTEIAFSLAAKYNAKFLQIDSVCGHLRVDADAHFAEKLSELSAQCPVFLLGGVRFKYQPVRSGRTLEEDLLLGKERCDAVVVTGEGTAQNTDIDKIKLFRNVLGNYPLFVGAGMTETTCREQMTMADGAIVGSWFKENGKTHAPVDPVRVKRFINIVKEVRENSCNQ